MWKKIARQAILFTYGESILCPMTTGSPFDILDQTLRSLPAHLRIAGLSGAVT
jgi:hypothetical protein